MSIEIENVTLGILVYKSQDWLGYVLDGIREAKNLTPSKTLVVANDPYPEIESDERVDYVFKNNDPDEYYINRVYRAWNKVVELSDTEWVCLLNSDMYVSDYWLDELVDCAKAGGTLPTSMLVESGVIPSRYPDYVRNFGVTTSTFDKDGWAAHAREKRRGMEHGVGQLYMPVLFRKSDFMRVGGYPCGNPGGVSGDRVLFKKFDEIGLRHTVCYGSIVYHVQEGEMRDERGMVS